MTNVVTVSWEEIDRDAWKQPRNHQDSILPWRLNHSTVKLILHHYEMRGCRPRNKKSTAPKSTPSHSTEICCPHGQYVTFYLYGPNCTGKYILICIWTLFFILLSFHRVDLSEIKLTPRFSNKNLSGNDVDRLYDHSYTTDIFGYVYIQWRHWK